jgi:hypothetical protein
MRLRAIAHARSGDKGTTANIALIAYDQRDYPRLAAEVTPERVKAWFSELVAGDVHRYELPHIGALNFVLFGVIGGGVTRTLALDPHGKSFSSALLEMEIPDVPAAMP